MDQTDNPLSSRQVKEEALLYVASVRDMNMTHSKREREAMQWAGRGTHLINHLVLSLPSPHILLESLPLLWLRNTLQSRRVAAALRGYYWT